MLIIFYLSYNVSYPYIVVMFALVIFVMGMATFFKDYGLFDKIMVFIVFDKIMVFIVFAHAYVSIIYIS